MQFATGFYLYVVAMILKGIALVTLFYEVVFLKDEGTEVAEQNESSKNEDGTFTTHIGMEEVQQPSDEHGRGMCTDRVC